MGCSIRRPSSTAGIAAITLAELAGGPHTTADADERARRQDRLLWATTTFDPYPFDGDAARAYGRVIAAVRRGGRQERRRVADLLIVATAASLDLPLFTRNRADFSGLEEIVAVHGV